jgi:hypothetical protein
MRIWNHNHCFFQNLSSAKRLNVTVNLQKKTQVQQPHNQWQDLHIKVTPMQPYNGKHVSLKKLNNPIFLSSLITDDHERIYRNVRVNKIQNDKPWHTKWKVNIARNNIKKTNCTFHKYQIPMLILEITPSISCERTCILYDVLTSVTLW